MYSMAHKPMLAQNVSEIPFLAHSPMPAIQNKQTNKHARARTPHSSQIIRNELRRMYSTDVDNWESLFGVAGTNSNRSLANSGNWHLFILPSTRATKPNNKHLNSHLCSFALPPPPHCSLSHFLCTGCVFVCVYAWANVLILGNVDKYTIQIKRIIIYLKSIGCSHDMPNTAWTHWITPHEIRFCTLWHLVFHSLFCFVFDAYNSCAIIWIANVGRFRNGFE